MTPNTLIGRTFGSLMSEERASLPKGATMRCVLGVATKCGPDAWVDDHGAYCDDEMAPDNVIETVPEAPVAARANCWTCRHDVTRPAGNHVCYYEGDAEVERLIPAWAKGNCLPPDDMPPKDADGCPGYASRAAGNEAPSERAQIVAYLRYLADAIRIGSVEPANREAVADLAADAIERGAHLQPIPDPTP